MSPAGAADGRWQAEGQGRWLSARLRPQYVKSINKKDRGQGTPKYKDASNLEERGELMEAILINRAWQSKWISRNGKTVLYVNLRREWRFQPENPEKSFPIGFQRTMVMPIYKWTFILPVIVTILIISRKPAQSGIQCWVVVTYYRCYRELCT